MEKELILCDTNILISWFKGEAKTLIQLEAKKRGFAGHLRK
jgi:hypothetical protein